MGEQKYARLTGEGWDDCLPHPRWEIVEVVESPSGNYTTYEGYEVYTDDPAKVWSGVIVPQSDFLASKIVSGAGTDPVNNPSHYTSDPSGVECIEITRHRNFDIGNAIKYLWRAGLKQDLGQDQRVKHIEDLRKAIFYIEDEISRLEVEIGDNE